MPKVIYMDENAVIIECEHVPWRKGGEADIQSADQLEANYCSQCGFRIDANLRSEMRMAQSGGTQDFRITCGSPRSELFDNIKKELRAKGLIK